MLLVVAVVAKLTSLKAEGDSGWHGLRSSFFWAPWLCIASWRRRDRLADRAILPVIGSCLLDIVVLAAIYVLLIPRIAGLPWWLQAYLAAVPFWLLLVAISSLCRLLWLPSGQLVPAIDHQPWRAKSLADFWGRRWNRLIGDWLAQVVFRPMRRRPRRAVLATFIVSGLLHELVVSLPLAVVYGESVWGWFVGYFLLQYCGGLLEHHLRLASPARRVLLWLVVLLPLPLVLNRGTLLIFHLGG